MAGTLELVSSVLVLVVAAEEAPLLQCLLGLLVFLKGGGVGSGEGSREREGLVSV